MKERPILFSGAMVRAILEGRKTQTRRVVKGEIGPCAYAPGKHALNGQVIEGNPGIIGQWPYGQPGDCLWVRETWALEDCGADGQRVIWQADRAARWVGDGTETIDSEVYYLPSTYAPPRWRPSIHIPRKHSRLTLEVTEVRVQRIQDISEEDARAEGVEPVISEHWTAYDPETEGYPSFGVEPNAETITRKRLENVRHHGPKVIATARQQFELLWNSINGERTGCSWVDNPFVWAITFKKAEG